MGMFQSWGGLTRCTQGPHNLSSPDCLLLTSVPMHALMGKERHGSLHLWWSLMQIGDCEVSPHLLGGSPLYFPPPRPQECRLHSIHQVRSCGNGETQRHMLTVTFTGSLGALYHRPPPPLPGQASAESSPASPRSPSLHPVPPVLMSRDLHLHWALGSHLQMVALCCGLRR